MRFLPNWFGSKKVETKSAPVYAPSNLSNPEPWLLDLFGATSRLPGFNVTPANAETSPAVRCAVASIAETVGGLPFHVFERGADDRRDRAPDHPAHALINGAANDHTTGSALREAVTRDALLHDQGGFAFIARDGEGRAVELHRLDPAAMSVTSDNNGPIYKSGGQEIDRRNVIHLRAPNGSAVKRCRDAISLQITMLQSGVAIFANAAHPSTVISLKTNQNVERMTAEAVETFMKTFEASMSGHNKGRPALIEDGEIKTLTFSSTDAQFAQLWHIANLEIARAFNVPPGRVQDYTRETFTNAEEGDRQFLKYSIKPWLERWQGEVTLKLIEPDDRRQFYPEFIVEDLQSVSYSERMDGYQKAIASMWMTPNEVRARENLPPRPEGDQLVNPNTTATTAKPSPNE